MKIYTFRQHQQKRPAENGGAINLSDF